MRRTRILELLAIVVSDILMYRFIYFSLSNTGVGAVQAARGYVPCEFSVLVVPLDGKLPISILS